MITSDTLRKKHAYVYSLQKNHENYNPSATGNEHAVGGELAHVNAKG